MTPDPKNEDETPKLCRDPRWRKHGQQSPWDHPIGKGSGGQGPQAARNAMARRLCLVCPALDWCEARLVRYEQAGIYIDGIVAGRTTDVQLGRGGGTYHITHCCGCGRLMRPFAPGPRRVAAQRKQWECQHAGEGLCTDCYPLMSRKKGHHVNPH